MRRIIREEEPPRPSARLSTLGETLTSVSQNRKTEPRKLRGLVRGDLDWIVMKALEKDRNRRYDTASEFSKDVQRYLHDEPVLAGRPSVTGHFFKFVRRHRKAFLVAAGFLVAISLTAIVAVEEWKRYYFDPRRSDVRGGSIPYLVKAFEGHVAIHCRSLTLIFEDAPESLIGENLWYSTFQIPYAGVVAVTNGIGAGGVSVSIDCDSHTNRIIFHYGDGRQCPMTIVEPGTHLTVGGKSVDLYGQPSIVRVHPDGTVD